MTIFWVYQGPAPAIVPLDLQVQNPAIYDTLRDELESAGGKLDGLIHNASLLGERRALAQTSPQSWNDVIQVNLTAQFLLTRSLMPLLRGSGQRLCRNDKFWRRPKRQGLLAPTPYQSLRPRGFMQVLADELGATSNISVNSLNPGAINTKMRRAAYRASRRTPTRRLRS